MFNRAGLGLRLGETLIFDADTGSRSYEMCSDSCPRPRRPGPKPKRGIMSMDFTGVSTKKFRCSTEGRDHKHGQH